MNINHLNVNSLGTQPQPSAPASPVRKVSVADSQVIAPIEPKAENTATESKEQTEQAVQRIQETIGNLAQNLRFSIDEDTGKTIIKVVDSQTDEIIRQFPSQEAVEIARALDKVQGLLFDGKA